MRNPRLRQILPASVLFLALAASAESPSGPGRWSVGASAWILANAFPDSPRFWYLEIERALGAEGSLVFEPFTWTYKAPIGIPYGSSFGDKAEEYAGSVRSVGFGLGWRQYLYQGLNASARAFHVLQTYEQDTSETEHGYQLFLQARMGWRWKAAAGIWIEPSIAFNAWPIETGRPESFRVKDERWPSYFLFEPWLNLGWSW